MRKVVNNTLRPIEKNRAFLVKNVKSAQNITGSALENFSNAVFVDGEHH
jgi:hypothetical protein